MLGRFPLIDGHNDLPWALRARTRQSGGYLNQVAFDLDTPAGGLHLAFGGITRGAPDRRIKAPLQTAVEHQRRDHIAGDVRASEPAQHLRPA